jgi:uncharacterized coiled-coil DUF342 family protein
VEGFIQPEEAQVNSKDLVTELRAWGTNNYMMQAADEIERLRKERDEARREVCQFRSTSYPHDMKEVYEIADSRGWDCFKEDGK